MDKTHRTIDPIRMASAKERSMEYVMDAIHQEEAQPSFFKRAFKPIYVPILTLALVLVVLLFPNGTTPEPPVTINAYESQKLAEISYITSSFVGANIDLSNNNIRFLNTGDTTEFEDNEDVINFYFDSLRVFLEDDFENSVTITEITEGEYQYLITFTLSDIMYEFYVTIDDEGSIVGQLHVDALQLSVTGSIEETDNETTFIITAENGEDYVSIEYKMENEEELETKYTIQQRINGVLHEKEVKISKEDNEEKVEIIEGNNEYQLKKEVEDGETTYKLEYSINGTTGEAKIRVGVDENGQTQYSYQIKEGDQEKEIKRGKPEYDYEDKGNNGGNDNEGNGNGNDSDDGSGNGSGSNQGQGQSYPEEYIINQKTI